MGASDLSDAMVETVVETLERGRDEITAALGAKNYQIELGPFFSDEISTISKYPAIQVVAGPKDVEWAAQRVRRETYNLFVDVLIKNVKKEEAMRLLRSFAGATQNWLNDFDNLRFTVKDSDVLVYDSRCTRIEYGHRRGGALRAARLSWYGKTVNPISAPL